MEKCLLCNKEENKENMFEHNIDKEINGKWSIETHHICKECFMDQVR